MKTIQSLTKTDLHNKIALVRVGFNIADLKEDFRIRAVLPTLQLLVKKECTIVLIAHRGRPKLSQKPTTSTTLKPIAKILEKLLKKRVGFITSKDFKSIQKKIAAAPAGSIFLLENIRLHKGEKTNDTAFTKKLSSLGDLYINDAFPVSHRNDASIVGLPKYLPSYAGMHLQEEIKALDHFFKSHKKPLVVVLGGAKVSDKISVIEKLLPKAQWILVGGLAANTFLKARGDNIAQSIYEPNMIATAKKLLRHKKIILPIDFISHKGKYLDIGPLSTEIFIEKLQGAKTIFWNGPMGLFEDKRFSLASFSLAQEVARSHAFTLIGGGQTARIIHKLKLGKKINFISTGGGAMLDYLSNKKLPGIEALKKQ